MTTLSPAKNSGGHLPSSAPKSTRASSEILIPLHRKWKPDAWVYGSLGFSPWLDHETITETRERNMRAGLPLPAFPKSQAPGTVTWMLWCPDSPLAPSAQLLPIVLISTRVSPSARGMPSLETPGSRPSDNALFKFGLLWDFYQVKQRSPPSSEVPQSWEGTPKGLSAPRISPRVCPLRCLSHFFV